uniref:Metal transporter n=1 Tax=Caenorhabditis japonica TaxID=281687 RepID=A0A8R1I1E1_CAEJA
MMNVVKKTFELRQKNAEHVMTPIDRVTMICETQSITQNFLREVYEKGHSRLPVYDIDVNNICGVLNLKDLMLLMDDEGRGLDSDITAGTMLSLLEKRKKNCPESELSCIRTVPNQNCPEAELFVSELSRIRTVRIRTAPNQNYPV